MELLLWILFGLLIAVVLWLVLSFVAVVALAMVTAKISDYLKD